MQATLSHRFYLLSMHVTFLIYMYMCTYLNSLHSDIHKDIISNSNDSVSVFHGCDCSAVLLPWLKSLLLILFFFVTTHNRYIQVVSHCNVIRELVRPMIWLVCDPQGRWFLSVPPKKNHHRHIFDIGLPIFFINRALFVMSPSKLILISLFWLLYNKYILVSVPSPSVIQVNMDRVL